jgi:hypothetical protein
MDIHKPRTSSTFVRPALPIVLVGAAVLLGALALRLGLPASAAPAANQNLSMIPLPGANIVEAKVLDPAAYPTYPTADQALKAAGGPDGGMVGKNPVMRLMQYTNDPPGDEIFSGVFWVILSDDVFVGRHGAYGQSYPPFDKSYVWVFVDMNLKVVQMTAKSSSPGGETLPPIPAN